MQKYVISRLLLMLPTIIGISVIVFVAVRFLPGDAISVIVGNEAGGGPSPEFRQQIEKQYSLDQSVPKQYLIWVGHLARGNLGSSILSKRPITAELRNRMPVTLELGAIAIAISLLFAVPIGITSAMRQNTMLDFATRSVAIAFLAVPSFWWALLAITYGFQLFGWTPPIKYQDLWVDPLSNLQSVWLPAIILGVGISGPTMRLTRSTMLEILRQDYIRTARSKGLGARLVVRRHALRNALSPIVTVIGLHVPLVIDGTVILERIFSIPGMGSYLLSAIQSRDYPVVQAIVLISAMAVVVTNLVVDLSYALIDPRVRYSA
jgi:peptide/nickel transport system permease protein